VTHPFAESQRPKQIWLGKRTDQWPVQCFEKESQAAHWATTGTIDERQRKLVWGPIEVPADTPLLRGKYIPEERVLEAWE